MKTLADFLDRFLGGPEVYLSHWCQLGSPKYIRDRYHQACLGFYGGRTCDCWCHQDDGKGGE